MEFATRYVPAQTGGVGGDFYDAFVLPSGELWLMVGDVAGHGLEPAVIMGRLRASLRSYALLGEEPEAVLARADRKLQFFEPGRFATVLCGRALPPYSELRLASAGHLAPVLATVSEPARLVEIDVVPPLGAVSKLAPRAVNVNVPEGAVLLAFTDGLVERRGVSLEDGLMTLAAATRAAQPEVVCREVMDAMVGLAVPEDDIAVMAVRRIGAPIT
jgi:serine phosphatase RsbU (regulator of sigma subunit)